MKRNVLVFTGSYFPGYKGGGPTRSITGLVEALGDDAHFHIVTSDRDFTDTTPYKGIKANQWQRVGKADVIYLSPEKVKWGFLSRLMSSTDHDVLYLNSFFDYRFTILPLLLSRFRSNGNRLIVVAPRGQFSKGALGLKTLKKQAFIGVAKRIGLYKNIVWHASSDHEMKDILTVFDDAKILVAPVLTSVMKDQEILALGDLTKRNPEKTSGNLKLLFLSRISPMKNLVGALKILNGVKGEISFNIYGPLEDKQYWLSCQQLIGSLPQNITAHYCGEILHENVMKVFKEHHILFLPTRGENFGHVIVESLVAGCPVLISNETPWRDLEKAGVGWDVPLNQPERFAAVLQQCVDMDNAGYMRMSHCAKEFGRQRVLDPQAMEQNRRLFNITKM